MDVLASQEKALAPSHYYCNGCAWGVAGSGTGLRCGAFYIYIILADEYSRDIRFLS